jgi:hypothetical protein
VPAQTASELLPGLGAEPGPECRRVVVGRAARQHPDLLVGDPVPVREHVPGAGIGEHEPGQVRPVTVEQPRQAADRLEPAGAGKQVAEPVADHRDTGLQAVEQPPCARPDLPAGLGPRPDALPAGDLGQLPQVLPLGGVQAQRVGQRVHHRHGRVAVAALLDPDEVLHADPGQRRQLRAPQPRSPPAPPGRQAHRARAGGVAAGPKEVTQRRAHASSVRLRTRLAGC